MKLLKKQGKGNKPNRPIPDSEMDILHESNLLGRNSQEALVNTEVHKRNFICDNTPYPFFPVNIK